MRWDSVIDVDAPPHPARVRVIVSVDHRRAVDWCRRYGRTTRPHPDGPFIITSRDDAERMRGYTFFEDDEYIVLGPVDPKIVEAVDWELRVSKARKLGPRPVAV